MAEPMKWGNNSGCDFLNKKCVENGTTPFPKMFCTQNMSRTTYICTHNRLGVGYCATKMYDWSLPLEYRYFDNERYGGMSHFMDYCPYVAQFAGGSCAKSSYLQEDGSFIGPNSRCVKGDKLRNGSWFLGDLCVNTKCENGELEVQFEGDEKWYPCTEEKRIPVKKMGWAGSIVCPKYEDICYARPNPILLEELPAHDDDDQPAPANITWPIAVYEDPPLEPTPPTAVSADGEEKPSVNGGGVSSHTSKDAGTHGSITQTIPTGTTNGGRTELANAQILHNQGGAGSQGSATQNTPTNTDDGQSSDANHDRDTNGNGETVHVITPNAGTNLNIGIGDGSVTAAGHPSLLLLILVSAVTVGVSL